VIQHYFVKWHHVCEKPLIICKTAVKNIITLLIYMAVLLKLYKYLPKLTTTSKMCIIQPTNRNLFQLFWYSAATMKVRLEIWEKNMNFEIDTIIYDSKLKQRIKALPCSWVVSQVNVYLKNWHFRDLLVLYLWRTEYLHDNLGCGGLDTSL
jgi:hypothetical protein